MRKMWRTSFWDTHVTDGREEADTTAPFDMEINSKVSDIANLYQRLTNT